MPVVIMMLMKDYVRYPCDSDYAWRSPSGVLAGALIGLLVSASARAACEVINARVAPERHCTERARVCKKEERDTIVFSMFEKSVQ